MSNKFRIKKIYEGVPFTTKRGLCLSNHRPHANLQNDYVKTPSLCTSSIEKELIDRKGRRREPYLINSAIEELAGVARRVVVVTNDAADA